MARDDPGSRAEARVAATGSCAGCRRSGGEGVEVEAVRFGSGGGMDMRSPHWLLGPALETPTSWECSPTYPSLFDACSTYCRECGSGGDGCENSGDREPLAREGYGSSSGPDGWRGWIDSRGFDRCSTGEDLTCSGERLAREIGAKGPRTG